MKEQPILCTTNEYSARYYTCKRIGRAITYSNSRINTMKYENLVSSKEKKDLPCLLKFGDGELD